jgi:PleD family two-component response regulator
VSVKLLKRQERREALQTVFNSRPPEPTGMLAALKRGAYDKAMDALEPIYQRAKKLAKQAEQVLQKSQRLQSRPTAGHTPSSTR